MTEHTPPDTAIKAAARTLAMCDGYADWDRVFSQSLYLDDARAALTAALPHLPDVLDLMDELTRLREPTVKPDRDTIARAIIARYSSFDPISADGIADAVLAVDPRRTEAEVKAEALEEFAAAVEAEAEPPGDTYYAREIAASAREFAAHYRASEKL